MTNYQQYLLGIQQQYATIPRSTPLEPAYKIAGAITVNQAQMRAQTIKNNFQASLTASRPTTAEEYDGLVNTLQRSLTMIDRINPGVMPTIGALKKGRNAYLTTVTAENEKSIANFEFNAVANAFNQGALGANATVESYLNLASPDAQRTPIFRQKSEALRRAAPTLELSRRFKESKALSKLKMHYADMDFRVAQKVNPSVDEETWWSNYNNSYGLLTEEERNSPEHQLRTSSHVRNMQVDIAKAQQSVQQSVRSQVSKDYNVALVQRIEEDADTVEQAAQILETQTAQWSKDIQIDPQMVQGALNSVIEKQAARGEEVSATTVALTDTTAAPQEDVSPEQAQEDVQQAQKSADGAIGALRSMDYASIAKETGVSELTARLLAAMRAHKKLIKGGKQAAKELARELGVSIPGLEDPTIAEVSPMDVLRGVQKLIVKALQPSVGLSGHPVDPELLGMDELARASLEAGKDIRDALDLIDAALSPEVVAPPEKVNQEDLEDLKGFEGIVDSLRNGLAHEEDPATAYIRYVEELSESAKEYLADIDSEQREIAVFAGRRSLMEVAGDKIDTSPELETFIGMNLVYMTPETRKRLLNRQSELQSQEAKGESPAQQRQNNLAVMYGNNPISINKLGDPALAQALEFKESRNLNRWKPEDIGSYKRLAPFNKDHVMLADKHVQRFQEASKDLQTFASHMGIAVNIPAMDFTQDLSAQMDQRISKVDFVSNTLGGTKMVPLESDSEKAAHKAVLAQKTQPQIDEEVLRALNSASQSRNIDGNHLAQIYDKDDLAANYMAAQVSNKGFWLDRVPKQQHNGAYEKDVKATFQQMLGNEDYRTNSNTYDALIPTLTRSMQQQGGIFTTKITGTGAETRINTSNLKRGLQSGLVTISPGGNQILVPTEYKVQATNAVRDTLKRDDISILTSSGEVKKVVSPRKGDIKVMQSSLVAGIPDMLTAYVMIRDPGTGVFVPLLDGNQKIITLNLRG